MKQLFTRPVAPGKARLATILTVALSLPLAFVISGGAASGQTSATPSKPTIVLVHGGWADSSGWNGEISRLAKAGTHTARGSTWLPQKWALRRRER
jgi:pimeloyl-ACP methyl ester carboxylesterase